MLKQELTTLGETININALNNLEENVAEFLADLRAGVEELKIVAPQTPEEQYEIFMLKKRVIDTLVERVEIDIDRNLFVQIRLNLLDILRKDAESGGSTSGVQNFEAGTYTRINDICCAGKSYDNSLKMKSTKIMVWIFPRTFFDILFIRLRVLVYNSLNLRSRNSRSDFCWLSCSARSYEARASAILPRRRHRSACAEWMK